MTTNTLPGVHPGLPVYRDNDSFTYFREWGTGLLVGGFEPEAKPIWTEGVPPNFEFNLLPDDYDHFMQVTSELTRRRIACVNRMYPFAKRSPNQTKPKIKDELPATHSAR